MINVTADLSQPSKSEVRVGPIDILPDRLGDTEQLMGNLLGALVLIMRTTDAREARRLAKEALDTAGAWVEFAPTRCGACGQTSVDGWPCSHGNTPIR